jgi:hypothetical protein
VYFLTGQTESCWSGTAVGEKTNPWGFAALTGLKTLPMVFQFEVQFSY